HRGDVLAAAAYRVLQPSDAEEVAPLAAIEQVAGGKPAVAPRPRIRFPPLDVALRRGPRAVVAHDQSPGHARRTFDVVRIDAAALAAGARSSTAAWLGYVDIGHQRH